MALTRFIVRPQVKNSSVTRANAMIQLLPPVDFDVVVGVLDAMVSLLLESHAPHGAFGRGARFGAAL